MDQRHIDAVVRDGLCFADGRSIAHGRIVCDGLGLAEGSFGRVAGLIS